MMHRLRLARAVGVAGCVVYFITAAIAIAAARGGLELATVANAGQRIATDARNRIRSGGALTERSRGDTIVGALTDLRSVIDSGRAAREDRPLVLGRGLSRRVTLPIKDADDWDIVGLVAVPVAPFGGLTSLLLALIGATVVASICVVAALRRPIWLAAAAGTLGALTIWLASDTSAAIGRASRALARERGSVIGDPSQLPLPNAGVVATTLALGLLAAFAFWLAASWLASSKRRGAEVRDTVAAWTFLAPSLVHVVVFSLGPLLFTLWVSLHRWDLLSAEKPFIGLANYREMLNDALFWQSLRNTAIYALNVPVTMALALGAALLLHGRLRLLKLLRAVVFLPYIVSYVAIAMVWQWIYNYDFGLLNYLLRLVHLAPVDWLGDPRTALTAIMLVAVWVQLGFHMVVYLAGLQGIPEHLHEAARLDRASTWQRFRWITLPLLRPVSVYLFVTGIIWSFQVFTLVYVMTEGGPVHSTDVLVYQIYQNAWEFRRMGYASAMSWALFAILLVLTIAQWKVIGRKVEYV
jgi:multiple sugar transport system permease protein